KGSIYNAIIYIRHKGDVRLYEYICRMLYNIKIGYYGSSQLDITGPDLLGRYILNHKDIPLQNIHSKHNDWINSYVTYGVNTIVKTSYNGYYYENNYLNTSYYAVMYKAREVYGNYSFAFKIDFI